VAGGPADTALAACWIRRAAVEPATIADLGSEVVTTVYGWRSLARGGWHAWRGKIANTCMVKHDGSAETRPAGRIIWRYAGNMHHFH